MARKNEIKKLRGKNEAELQKELKEAKEELRSLKFDLEGGKVKNIGIIHETKKKIARIMTFLREAKMKENTK